MYLFNMLNMFICLSCSTLRLSIVNLLTLKSCLAHSLHVINFNSTYLIIFIFFLSFLFSRFFIMSKHHLDHFSLTQFILAEDVQMSFSCKHCVKQKKSCVVSDKSDKYSECVHSKKSCSFSFNSLAVNVVQLLKIHEKIEKKQTVFSDK